MPEKIVPDASVIVKWYVNEIWTDESLVLRDRFLDGYIDIHVPSLLFYEVLNVLRFKEGFDLSLLPEVYNSLIGYGFHVHNPNEGYLLDALSAVYSSGITIYDATYIGLASYLKTKLITADERLIRKIGDSNTFKVIHLRDAV